MGTFWNRLQPFLRFGQFAGLFPYQIESIKTLNGLYKRFAFTCIHPLTAWFIISFIFQFLPCMVSITLLNSVKKTNLVLPKSIILVYGVGTMIHYLTILVSRGVTLRYNQLRSFMRSIFVAQELEIFESFPHCQNSFRKRTFIGIFIIITSAFIQVLIQALGTFELVAESTGPTIALLNFGGLFFATVAIDIIPLMFHLSYYSVAHYIQLLRVRLTTNVKGSDPWRGSKQVLLHLYEATAALGTIFSVPVLYIITSKLVLISFHSFTIIYMLIRPKGIFVVSWVATMLTQLVGSLVNIWIILYSAELPVYQVRYFREQLIMMENSRLDLGIDEHLQIVSLLQHADEERFRLSAAGLFKVGMHLLPAVTGSIVTYLVILLQYQFDD